ncbi:MAG: hypothetical protein M3O46_21010 [Myxococcota bacterium]|nr:hypothetical protein [Myxococcota bacterium]
MGESNEKLTSSRPKANGGLSFVLAIRVGLLFFAACAAAAALFVLRSSEPSDGRSGARYMCPMHPEVTSPVRGECPICRMELEAINSACSGCVSAPIGSSTYQSYDIPRRRGTGPDAPSPAWVEADGKVAALVYKDELEGLPPDVPGIFYRAEAPSEPIRAHMLREPFEPWDRSTSRVRLEIEGTAPALRAGAIGWVRLGVKGRGVAVIPYHAILEGEGGPYVLVASEGGHTLTKRRVEIGKTYADMTFMLSGVRPNERILVRSAFFVDAERRLRREPTIEVTR